MTQRKRTTGCGGLKDRSPLAVAFLVLAMFPACSGSRLPGPPDPLGFRSVEAAFELAGDSQHEISFVDAESDGQDLLLIQYDKYERAGGENQGRFFRISKNGGSSFGPEVSALAVSGGMGNAICIFRFIEGGLSAVYRIDGNISYTRSFDDGATWAEPVQINDEQHSASWEVSFVQPSESDVYCLWQDTRRGYPLAYFSASSDGGRTWRPNQPVEYDFREGNQTEPKLVVGVEGRLIAVWEDWRDRQTLVDIRSSYSDDGGRHWSESRVINDDRQHVWQVSFDVVSKDGLVYVVFQDFREPGEEGDNDWNIYFTRSLDNGTNWSKNIRLNDEKEGADRWPALAIDEAATLYCAWAKHRGNVFGDIVFSHSTDGGQNWSRSVTVSEDERLFHRGHTDLITVARRRPLCKWLETSNRSSFYRLAWLEALPSPDPPAATKPDEAVTHPSPLGLEEGETLFADDFSIPSEDRWQRAEGTWMMAKGAYMGVATGTRFFSSYARFPEPLTYILKGRFMLDPVNHIMAYLYFRADPDAGRYYVISNRFRDGAWLGINDETMPAASRHWLNSRPLSQRTFPFQSNRWYNFKLVVTPEQIDYYVEGRLMLSYKGSLTLPPNKVGIGGWGQAPAHFDDIAIADVRHEAAQ